MLLLKQEKKNYARKQDLWLYLEHTIQPSEVRLSGVIGVSVIKRSRFRRSWLD